MTADGSRGRDFNLSSCTSDAFVSGTQIMEWRRRTAYGLAGPQGTEDHMQLRL